MTGAFIVSLTWSINCERKKVPDGEQSVCFTGAAVKAKETCLCCLWGGGSFYWPEPAQSSGSESVWLTPSDVQRAHLTRLYSPSVQHMLFLQQWSGERARRSWQLSALLTCYSRSFWSCLWVVLGSWTTLLSILLTPLSEILPGCERFKAPTLLKSLEMHL